jgi:malonate-semialdehyde dehydrogenase (acetylating)/methylmalonate-semialdehyde dehydrogenase
MESDKRYNQTTIRHGVGLFFEPGLMRCQRESSLQQLLRENADSIASSIVLEQGKTFAGFVYCELLIKSLLRTWTFRCTGGFTAGVASRGNSYRSVYYFARRQTRRCATLIRLFVNSILYPSPVSKDMDTYVRRVPLGVCASIAPFNFPA